MSPKIDIPLSEELAKIAVQDKQRYMMKHKTLQVGFICLCILLSVSLICATYFVTETMREKQYALNMQYAEMADLVGRMEVTKTTKEISQETGEGGANYYQNGDNNQAGGGKE